MSASKISQRFSPRRNCVEPILPRLSRFVAGRARVRLDFESVTLSRPTISSPISSRLIFARPITTQPIATAPRAKAPAAHGTDRDRSDGMRAHLQRANAQRSSFSLGQIKVIHVRCFVWVSRSSRKSKCRHFVNLQTRFAGQPCSDFRYNYCLTNIRRKFFCLTVVHEIESLALAAKIVRPLNPVSDALLSAEKSRATNSLAQPEIL